VIGLASEDAVAQLKDAHLDFKKVPAASDDPAGQVLDQTPRAVRRDSKERAR